MRPVMCCYIIVLKGKSVLCKYRKKNVSVIGSAMLCDDNHKDVNMEPSRYYAVRLLKNESNFVLVPESWILCWLSPTTVDVRYPSENRDVIAQTLKNGGTVYSAVWTLYHAAVVEFESRSCSKVDVWIQLSNNDSDAAIDQSVAETLDHTNNEGPEHKNHHDDRRIVLKITRKRSLPKETVNMKLKEQSKIKKTKKWNTEIVRNVNVTIKKPKDSYKNNNKEHNSIQDKIEKKLALLPETDSDRHENNKINLELSMVKNESQEFLDKYPVLQSSTLDNNTSHLNIETIKSDEIHTKLNKHSETLNQKTSTFKPNTHLNSENNNSQESPPSLPDIVTIKKVPVEETEFTQVLNCIDKYSHVPIKQESPTLGQRKSYHKSKIKKERDVIIKSLISSETHFPKTKCYLNQNTETKTPLAINCKNSNRTTLKDLTENIIDPKRSLSNGKTQCKDLSTPISFTKNEKDTVSANYDHIKLDPELYQHQYFCPTDRKMTDAPRRSEENTHENCSTKTNELSLRDETNSSQNNIAQTNARCKELITKSPTPSEMPIRDLKGHDNDSSKTSIDQHDMVILTTKNKDTTYHNKDVYDLARYILRAVSKNLLFQPSEEITQPNNLEMKSLQENYPSLEISLVPFDGTNQINKDVHITEIPTAPNQQSLMTLPMEPINLSKHPPNINIPTQYSDHPPRTSHLLKNTNNINGRFPFKVDNKVTEPVRNSYVLPSKTRKVSSSLQYKQNNSNKTINTSNGTYLNTSIASLYRSPSQFNTYHTVDSIQYPSVPTRTTAAFPVNSESNVVSNNDISKRTHQFPNIPNSKYNNNISSNCYSYSPYPISNYNTGGTRLSTTLSLKEKDVFQPANKKQNCDDLTNLATHINFPNTQNSNSTPNYNVTEAPNNYPNVYSPYHYNELPQVSNRKDDANMLTAPPRQCCVSMNHTNSPATTHGSLQEVPTISHDFLPYPSYQSQYINDSKQDEYSVDYSSPLVRNDYVRDQNTNELYFENYSKVNDSYQAMTYKNIDNSSPLIELNVALPHLPPEYQFHPTQNKDVYGKNIIHTGHIENSPVFHPQVRPELPNNQLFSQVQNDYHNKSFQTYSDPNYKNNFHNTATTINNGLSVTNNLRSLNNTAIDQMSPNDLHSYHNSILNEINLVKRFLKNNG